MAAGRFPAIASRAEDSGGENPPSRIPRPSAALRAFSEWLSFGS